MSEKSSPLQSQWQNHAWKQFLMARSEMLNAYDNAKNKGIKRTVKIDHGKVAEAEFRKWLTTFLPKKYGVTSGYIISQGTPKDEYLSHYDVIIYEQLEAPILYVDENPDFSEQGQSLAIPVEHVRGVIEVKSAFSKKTAADAVTHLAKLKPLLQKVDMPQHPTKLYLPRDFFCATVFFELRKEQENDFEALDNIQEAIELRGFYGGYILRSDTLDEFYSGKIDIVLEDQKYSDNNKSLFFWSYSQSKKFNENLYCRLRLTHCESYFSQFAFDIIALLKGNYRPGVLSSLYGMGTTAWENGSAVSIQYHNIEDKKKWDESTREFMETWKNSQKGKDK